MYSFRPCLLHSDYQVEILRSTKFELQLVNTTKTVAKHFHQNTHQNFWITEFLDIKEKVKF